MSVPTEDKVTETLQQLIALSSEDNRDKLLDARTEVLKSQRIQLLQAGEVQLRLAKGEKVDETRRTVLNQALNLIECYLISLECALAKIDFLRQVLNQDTDAEIVQNQIPYQSMLEELLVVQSVHANRLLNKEPSLAAMVTPQVFHKERGILMPFKNMCVMKAVPEKPSSQ
jgi:hypothetical protein